jgi:hypothetical protein
MATALHLPTLTPGHASDGERGYALRLRMAYLLAIIFALALIAIRNPPLVKFRGLSIEDVFSVLDVLITGALLGGADAIHKIVSTFTTLMEATKSRVKAAS